MTGGVSAGDIREAQERVAGHVQRTPLVRSAALSARAGHPVFLKLESVQETGSFKLRGATNRLLSLTDAERARGAVAVSTGNHGRALAHAGRALGVRTVICLSSLVPPHKVAAIRDLGAEVHVVEGDQDDAERAADRLAAQDGLVTISPFDDPAVIAGQGTIGLEILADLPAVDAIIVPLSGGGLIGGIAVAVKAARPAVRVVGVTMESGPAMVLSQQAGRPVPVEEVPTLADSLSGSIGLNNQHTFGLVRDFVDHMVLVSEAEIAAGMRHAYREERLILEGGAAVGIAALLHGRIPLAEDNTVIVLSGRNVDMDRFTGIVAGVD